MRQKISLTREAYDKENPCILQVCSYLPSTTTILLIFIFFLFILIYFILKDEAGDTPLYDAIASEKHNMVDMLLNNPRLSMTVTNKRGFNYLQFAVLKGNTRYVIKIRRSKYPLQKLYFIGYRNAEKKRIKSRKAARMLSSSDILILKK